MRHGLSLALAVVLSLAGWAGVRGEDAAEPGPHTRTTDVIYGRKFGMALLMDVYRPKKDANGAAIVVVVSGGWVSSNEPLDPKLLNAILQEPLKRGYTVFAVYHGSQPKFTIPEVIADINRAVRYIRAHAADYQIDGDRLGITGGSAGGHLSLMLGTAGDAGDPKSKDPVERVSSRVQAVACFFPPTDFLNYGGKDKNAFAPGGIIHFLRAAVDVREFDPKTQMLERVTDEKKQTELLRKISPISHVSAGSAPTLIVHGDADGLVPIQQSEAFVARLKEAGVPTELIVKKGVGHVLAGMEAEQIRCIDWFDKHLKKK